MSFHRSPLRRRLQESNQEGGDLGDESCRPAALAQERIDLIEALAQKPDVYERLARAIAPSIYENEDIKKGILLQLFGGSKKDLSATGRGRFRTEINILLCGDPGTSKSQLLQYVYNLVPRSQVRRSNKSPKSTEISKLHFPFLFALLVVRT